MMYMYMYMRVCVHVHVDTKVTIHVRTCTCIIMKHPLLAHIAYGPIFANERHVTVTAQDRS